MGSAATKLQPLPVKVRIRWHDPVTFDTAAHAPKADFFEFNKGPDAPDAVVRMMGEPKKEEAHRDVFDYDLDVPRERILVGVRVGDQIACLQVAPGGEARVVDLPAGPVKEKKEALIKVNAEEYVPTLTGPPEKKLLERATISAELVAISGPKAPREPTHAERTTASAVIKGGKAEFKVRASGLYKVSVATSEAYAGSNPTFPFLLFVSSGEVVDLSVVFEPFADQGEITGTLLDDNDQPFVNRRVCIHSETGHKYEAQTDEKGHFRRSVPKGRYKVFAEEDELGFAVRALPIEVMKVA